MYQVETPDKTSKSWGHKLWNKLQYAQTISENV